MKSALFPPRDIVYVVYLRVPVGGTCLPFSSSKGWSSPMTLSRCSDLWHFQRQLGRGKDEGSPMAQLL